MFDRALNAPVLGQLFLNINFVNGDWFLLETASFVTFDIKLRSK